VTQARAKITTPPVPHRFPATDGTSEARVMPQTHNLDSSKACHYLLRHLRQRSASLVGTRAKATTTITVNRKQQSGELYFGWS